MITRENSALSGLGRVTKACGFAAVLAVGFLASEKTASAQEIQLTGPLAGAPAVKHERLYRKGRFEVAPGFSFTLLDEYRRQMMPSLRLQYNITDWLGIGVWGAAGVINPTTDLTDKIDAKSPSNPQTWLNVSGNYKDQTGTMQWIAAPQLQAVPFRGKIALFQKIFVDTDAYFHGGLAFVGLKERANCEVGQCVGAERKETFDMSSRTALAPTFGLGFNFYLPFSKGLMALNLEYRALPFSWNRGGFDSRGAGENGKFPDQRITSADQTFKFNQLIGVNIGFSFPKLKVSDVEEEEKQEQAKK